MMRLSRLGAGPFTTALGSGHFDLWPACDDVYVKYALIVPAICIHSDAAKCHARQTHATAFVTATWSIATSTSQPGHVATVNTNIDDPLTTDRNINLSTPSSSQRSHNPRQSAFYHQKATRESTAAKEAVFGTAEVPEDILITAMFQDMTHKELLLAQRVSVDWKATTEVSPQLQKLLGLRAASTDQDIEFLRQWSAKRESC